MKLQQVRTGLVSLTATVLLASSLLGCEGKTHDEHVDAAEGRWKLVRSKVMLDTAQTQFDTGQLELCEHTLKEAISFDPDNGKLMTLYGRLQLEQGRLERAYHLFTNAIQNEPKLHEPHYYLGVVLQRWQQYSNAYDAYASAFALEPDNASYLMAMSEMLVAMDRTEQALVLLGGKLIYFDQNAGIRSAMGHLYGLTGDHAKSVEMFRQASQLDPENIKLLEDLALAQLANEDDPGASATLTVLLSHEEMEDRDDLRRLLASAYDRQGDTLAAYKIYYELTRQRGADVGDWVRLGELAWKQGDDGSTLHAANRIVKLAPDRHEGYLLAGLVWQKRDRLDDALAMYDRAADVAPQNASPLILRGIALQKAGRKQAAADAYTEALTRQPEDPRAMRLLQAVANTME